MSDAPPAKTPRLNTFQRLALATTLGTYLLILVGSLVRVSGAGLGCPDWPKCFGQWVPPTDVSELPPGFDPALFNAVHTWTEYLNRLLGALIGLLIFATLVMAIARYRKAPRILWPTVGAFILVGFEAWLGGQVVALELKSWIVTAHLVFALLVVSLLLYATVSAFFEDGRPLDELPGSRRVLGIISNAVTALVLLQIALGAMVRGSIQQAVEVYSELPRGEWLEHVGALDIAHRQLAVLCFFACVALWWRTRKRHGEAQWLVRFSAACVLLAGAQIVAGLVLAYVDMPGVVQVLHLSLASLLLGALTGVTLLAYRLPVREGEALVA
jgi:cytochrome c oxidase assembly protein subunit 15